MGAITLKDQSQDPFLGLSETEQDENMCMIFPNSVNTSFIISNNSTYLFGEKAMLTDLMGKAVMEFQVSESSQ
jgi:hypothetical protein